jgi:hypothetical protein
VLKNQKSILITVLALGLCLSLAQAQTTITYSGKMTGTNPALDANGWWESALGTSYNVNIAIRPELGFMDPQGLMMPTPGYQVSWMTCWTPNSDFVMRCVYVSGWAPANTPGIVKQSADAYRVNLDRNMILAGDGTPGGSIMTRCYTLSELGCTPPAESTSWPVTGTFSTIKPSDPEGVLTTQINGQLSRSWIGPGSTETLSFSGSTIQSDGKFVGQVGGIPMPPVPEAGLRGTVTYYKGAMKVSATYISN